MEDSGDNWHSFEAFLCKEFSIENALFWKAVDSLKYADEDEIYGEKANRIYEHFEMENMMGGRT
jgi:hypothetical protein